MTCFTRIVNAWEVPAFIRNTYPEQAIDAAVQDMDALESEDAALSPKVRELIGLGVAAQIPFKTRELPKTSDERSLRK